MCVTDAIDSDELVQFCDQPDERLTCPICKRVFNEPWQTSCGHRFCKKCLEPLLRYFTLSLMIIWLKFFFVLHLFERKWLVLPWVLKLYFDSDISGFRRFTFALCFRTNRCIFSWNDLVSTLALFGVNQLFPKQDANSLKNSVNALTIPLQTFWQHVALGSKTPLTSACFGKM